MSSPKKHDMPLANDAEQPAIKKQRVVAAEEDDLLPVFRMVSRSYSDELRSANVPEVVIAAALGVWRKPLPESRIGADLPNSQITSLRELSRHKFDNLDVAIEYGSLEEYKHDPTETPWQGEVTARGDTTYLTEAFYSASAPLKDLKTFMAGSPIPYGMCETLFTMAPPPVVWDRLIMLIRAFRAACRELVEMSLTEALPEGDPIGVGKALNMQHHEQFSDLLGVAGSYGRAIHWATEKLCLRGFDATKFGAFTVVRFAAWVLLDVPPPPMVVSAYRSKYGEWGVPQSVGDLVDVSIHRA